MQTPLTAPSVRYPTFSSRLLSTGSLSVIHLTTDEALALHHADTTGWSAAQALAYLARRARARGEHAHAIALLDEASSP
jgi:hypothetical protein